jgi:hypothetical protein
LAASEPPAEILSALSEGPRASQFFQCAARVRFYFVLRARDLSGWKDQTFEQLVIGNQQLAKMCPSGHLSGQLLIAICQLLNLKEREDDASQLNRLISLLGS